MVSETHKIYAFQGLILLSHIAYLAIFLGIFVINKAYLHQFDTLIQFGVCMLLIYKTFPYQKIHRFTEFDHNIIFYCATFLLMNVVAMEMYNEFVQPLYSEIRHAKTPLSNGVGTWYPTM